VQPYLALWRGIVVVGRFAGWAPRYPGSVSSFRGECVLSKKSNVGDILTLNKVR
jgi:hypothetical protein